MLDRLYQAYLRRQDRKLWRGVCAELGIDYAEPTASGTVDGLRVAIQVLERNRPTTIETGLPATIGFTTREDVPAAPAFGDTWFDAAVALRGDLAFWLRVLDRPTRKSLDDLVRMSAATLADGTLTMRESLRAKVMSPTVAERVEPIRAAIAVAKRLLAAVADGDDSALYAACKRGSQRERLVAVTVVRSQRATDPRTAALLAELDADREPETQMLAALASARWARVAALAGDFRFGSRLLFETIETLCALYPKLESLPAVVALDAAFRDRTTPIYDEIDREPQSRARVVAALKAICDALASPA